MYSSLTGSKTYNPTVEEYYRANLVVDNNECVINIVDTAGLGELNQPFPRNH
jgi:hypothetical protein